MSAFQISPISPRRQRSRLATTLFLGFIKLIVVACAGAQSYTSIVVFGDSLSDTGNDAAVSSALYTVNAQVPGPATGYTNGRFTDGTDTSPAARSYTGVWIEQFAAQLGAKPPMKNSLAGGTNYAYGFATTDIGTSNFAYGPGNVLSFNVNNMGQQVADYMATKPIINNKTLFVVWGGANDLINATSSADIVNAASRDAGLIQLLINAGATDFVIPNLPPLGLVPRFNGSSTTSAPASAAALGFNQALAAAIAQVVSANSGKTLNIYTLDIATLFNTIVATPTNYGLLNVTASSQGNSAANPDNYLFWDDLHPTTAGHHLIAASVLRMLGTPVKTTASVVSSNAGANLNAPVTLTATIANSLGGSDTPLGTVTFLDSGKTIGTAFLTGSGANATAALTTSTLAAGSHTITVSYVGVNGFASSTSSSLSEIVTAPAFAAGLSATTSNISRGSSAQTTATITPAGGYTGSFTATCGALPAHFSCSIATPVLNVTGTSSVSTNVVISTETAEAALRPQDDRRANYILATFAGIPFFGSLALFGRRKKNLALIARSGVCALLLCATFVIGGCSSSSSSNDAPSGTYQIPITVTPATGTANTLTFTVVIL